MATKRSVRLMIVRAAQDAEVLDILHRHTALYQRKNMLSLVDLPLLLSRQRNIPELLPHLAPSADGALFVLSEHYLSSGDCLDIQATLLANSSFLCIPLLYKTCDWEELSELKQRMPLPRNREFVQKAPSDASVWTEIARDLGTMAKQLQPNLKTLQKISLDATVAKDAIPSYDLAREYLATNQFTPLFDQLSEDSAALRDVQNELILLKGTFQQLDFQKRNGLLSTGDAQIEMAKIRFSLLQLIDKVYQ